jgi:hypothetical protein
MGSSHELKSWVSGALPKKGNKYKIFIIDSNDIMGIRDVLTNQEYIYKYLGEEKNHYYTLEKKRQIEFDF